MALTFGAVTKAPSPTPVVRSSSLAGLKLRFVKLTTDNAYTVGGYAMTPANFNLDTAIVFIACNEGVSGFCPTWDSAAQKMKFWKVGAAGPATECAANEAGLNNAVFDLFIIGY